MEAMSRDRRERKTEAPIRRPDSQRALSKDIPDGACGRLRRKRS
jgi:hypothetical protein